MALTIDRCLIGQGSGTNEMYATCCCTFSCIVTNPDATRIIVADESGFFNSIDYTLSNFLIDGNPASYPFTIEQGQQFTMEFTVCAATDINVAASLSIKFYDSNAVAGTFNFDFITIDTNTTVDVTSIDFSNVPLGSSASIPITFDNPTACCYEYFLTSDCADVTFEPPQTNLLCSQDRPEIVNVVYAPTSLDGLGCTITIEAGMCFTLQIPVTGRAIEPPSGGGTSNGQKNKVDQTTPVANCSPRTANNRCQTARTMQSAIRTNARRFGKR
jgi:hypothetical protein